MGASHQLRIAEGFTLGDDFVTKTAAIVAQRRKGKTYTACVIAEELVEAGLPWVALDPTGAWWGMRASADGKSAGLPVVVLGGSHGDAPLERSAGRAVADLVVEHPGWYVLDLSLFESKAAEREFSADFAEALYRRKGAPGRDFPLHLFVDEADMFVPQDREQGDARMLGAFQSIVRRGGLRGLGTTLISQRPALVNKSVLVQLDMLIVLRLVAGNDQDYVKKNYFERAGKNRSSTSWRRWPGWRSARRGFGSPARTCSNAGRSASAARSTRRSRRSPARSASNRNAWPTSTSTP
jgi:DNA helicase HerA-like ATPase